MFRPKLPMYMNPYVEGWKIYVVFWWCNLNCKDCKKSFLQKNIIYLRHEQLVEIILKSKVKTVVFTWGESALYEPLIGDIQETLDKKTWYKKFFDWEREIVTNWYKSLWWYYDKVIVRYKLNWWRSYEIKARGDYDYVFTIKSLEDLYKLEEVIEKNNLSEKRIILQTENSSIQLAQYCRNKWFKYRNYTDIC